jgi:hypothetical protein
MGASEFGRLGIWSKYDGVGWRSVADRYELPALRVEAAHAVNASDRGKAPESVVSLDR